METVNPEDSIEGYFDFADAYEYLLSHAPDNARVCEVGCWRGKSMVYLARRSVELSKPIQITAVDIWPGDTFPEFQSHTKDYHFITCVQKWSIDAAKDFPDEHFFSVFIDANHDSPNPKQDISAWYPKVQKRGLLFGHDYGVTFPDVVKAVDERFPNVGRIGGSVWYHWK